MYFQVWSKYHKNDLFDFPYQKEEDIKIYSVSDGGTSSSIRNKKMHDKCHIFYLLPF